MVRFVGEVRQVGYRSLHAIRHFVLSDAGGDFGVSEFAKLQLVELDQIVQNAASSPFVEARRVGEVKNGIPDGSKLDSLIPGGQEATAPQSVVERLPDSPTALRDHHDETW